MIKTNIVDGKEYASVEDLYRWSKNPKIVLKEDFERLKRHITKFGQFKPLVITPDGEVIGGNSRYEAFKSMGIKEAWVSIVNPKSHAEKVEIALADNDEVGKYLEEELAQLITDVGEEIVLKDYKVNIGKDIDLDALLKNLGPSGDGHPTDDERPEENNEDKIVTCPNCGHNFSVLKEVS